MGEFLKIRDLKMVDVRKYDGVENGKEAWTFLGYDIVSFDEEGKAVSILAAEETKYDVLKKVYSEEFKRDFYDHSGISIGDIRVKVVENENTQEAFIGRLPVTTKSKIRERLDKQAGFYFLHYQPVKVKKIGSK